MLEGHNITPDDLRNSPVLLQHDFLKLHGGPLKNKKQLRTLRLHQIGYLSYSNKAELRGFFPITKDAKVGAIIKKGSEVQFYIEIS